jgi:hypothetical protein
MSPTKILSGAELKMKERYTNSNEVLSKSMEWENENLYPINLKLKELSNEITKDHTTALHKAKTQAIKYSDNSVITKRYVGRLDKILMSYTSLAHASK